MIPAWSTLVAVALAVLLAVAGVLLLLGQIPAAPRRSTLRVSDGSELLGSLAPQVLDRALEESVESLTGVHSADVRCAGGVRAPSVQASVIVEDDSEIEWIVEAVRSQLSDQVETVLGVAPLRVDLVVGLR